MGVFPEGTRAEIEAKGADLVNTPSCSRHEKGRNMGCEHWSKCIFASPSCGNLWDGPGPFLPFRDNGPRNVGYDIALSPADGGAQKNDYAPCNVFMGNLFNRARNEENSGERIRIIAVEGQPIVYSEKVAEDPTGKTSMAIIEKIKTIKVPPFQRVGTKFATKYEEAIRDAKAKRTGEEVVESVPEKKAVK